MKKLLFLLLFLLSASNSYAEKFEIEVPDNEIEDTAYSMGYEDRVISVDDQKRMVRINNPLNHSEYIKTSLEKFVALSKLQKEIGESRKQAIRSQQDIENAILNKPEYKNVKGMVQK